MPLDNDSKEIKTYLKNHYGKLYKEEITLMRG